MTTNDGLSDASVSVRLASLEGTVRGWADLTEHRLGNVERDTRTLRADVDALREGDSERKGRAGLLVASASIGTGLVAALLGPAAAAWLGIAGA